MSLKAKAIPQEVIDMFVYDETSISGLRWKVDRYRGKPSYVFIKAGSSAGSVAKNGYYKVSLQIEGRLVSYAVHRIVYSIVHSYLLDPEDHIDHIDGNKLNNTKQNLRKVNKKLNGRNQKKHVTNTSGVTGVQRREYTSKFTSRISVWFSACWVDHITGKRHMQSFKVQSDEREEIAKQKAINYRKMKIEQMNLQGAGYYEKHGEEK